MIDRVETFTDLPDLRPGDRTGGRSEIGTDADLWLEHLADSRQVLAKRGFNLASGG